MQKYSHSKCKPPSMRDGSRLRESKSGFRFLSITDFQARYKIFWSDERSDTMASERETVSFEIDEPTDGKEILRLKFSMLGSSLPMGHLKVFLESVYLSMS